MAVKGAGGSLASSFIEEAVMRFRQLVVAGAVAVVVVAGAGCSDSTTKPVASDSTTKPVASDGTTKPVATSSATSDQSTGDKTAFCKALVAVINGELTRELLRSSTQDRIPEVTKSLTDTIELAPADIKPVADTYFRRFVKAVEDNNPDIIVSDMAQLQDHAKLVTWSESNCPKGA